MNLIFATLVMMALMGLLALITSMIGARLPDLLEAVRGGPAPKRAQAGGWSASARRTARA